MITGPSEAAGNCPPPTGEGALLEAPPEADFMAVSYSVIPVNWNWSVLKLASVHNWNWSVETGVSPQPYSIRIVLLSGIFVRKQ